MDYTVHGVAKSWTRLSDFHFHFTSTGGANDKEPPPNAGDMRHGTRVPSLGWEDPLEEGMATHSSMLSWRILMDRGVWWAIVYEVAKIRT